MKLRLDITVLALAAGLLISAPPPPPLEVQPIPYGPQRKRQMAAYSARHYGEATWRLRRPRVIVEHMAQAGSVGAVYNTFARNVPDVELHELPGVCAHFVISPGDGSSASSTSAPAAATPSASTGPRSGSSTSATATATPSATAASCAPRCG